MDRPDDWSFGRYEKDGIPIRGMTYFRINRGDSLSTGTSPSNRLPGAALGSILGCLRFLIDRGYGR
jgi:hypothetical protein